MKTFLYFVGVLFLAKVLFIVLIWLFKGLKATLNGKEISFWVFILGIVVDSYIAYQALAYAAHL